MISRSLSGAHSSGSGWTGVQYSIVRILLAIVAAWLLAARVGLADAWISAVLLLGMLACVPLALGLRDRVAALCLVPIVGILAALIDGAPLDLPAAGVALTTCLLLLHALVPPAPFGSHDAAGRVDPRGDWHRPALLGDAAWLLLVITYFGRGIAGSSGVARAEFSLELPILALVVLVFEVAMLSLGLWRRLRPIAWITLCLWRVAWLTAFGAQPGDASLLVLYAFACEPAWFPGRSLRTRAGDGPESRRATLYYDGDCGFCHRAVRFILSEDAGTPEALRLRFAPLDSESFEARVARDPELDRDALPDSIVLDLEDETLLLQSAAAIEIASRLGGLWRGLALIGQCIPSGVLDRGYDFIARIRKRLFVQPKDACPILPPELRARFDP